MELISLKQEINNLRFYEKVIPSIHLEVRKRQQQCKQNIFSNITDSQKDLSNINEFYLQKGGDFFVAKEQNSIIGFVGLKMISDKIGMVKRFAVQEKFRGNGYGTSLLQKLIETAKSKKLEKIQLFTGINENAINIYLRAGFEIIDYANDGKDYLMELKLS